MLGESSTAADFHKQHGRECMLVLAFPPGQSILVANFRENCGHFDPGSFSRGFGGCLFLVVHQQQQNQTQLEIFELRTATMVTSREYSSLLLGQSTYYQR
jgi:hypothetical protein